MPNPSPPPKPKSPPTPGNWTGAKVIVISAACCMLGYGLCASGIGTRGGAGGYVFLAAAVLFLGGGIGILVGIILAATQKR